MTRGERQEVAVRRDEILRAAVVVVQRQGLAGTRVADVAAELGVSPALVHYHFTTKDRLLAAVFTWAAQRALTTLDAALQAADGGEAATRLAALVQACVPADPASPLWRLWIESWAAALRSPEIRAATQQLDQRRRAEFAAVLAEGAAAGEFQCEDPDASAVRLTALVDGLAVQIVVHGRHHSLDDLTTWIASAAAAEAGVSSRTLFAGGELKPRP